MNYIKTGIWIFALSVLYATGIFSFFRIRPELLFSFALLYSVFSGSFTKKTIVFVVCGIITSALGGRNFLLSVLLLLYSGYIFDWIVSNKLSERLYLSPIFIFLFTIIFETVFHITEAVGKQYYIIFLSSAVNGITALLMYPILKRAYVKCERCIF